MSTAIQNNTRLVERPRFSWGLVLVLFLFVISNSLMAQAGGSNTNAFNFNIGMNLPEEPKKVDVAIRIVFLITLLTVAPSLVMLMTSFTRIIIVFSFLRNALSLQGVPANQILVGFALFMTFFIMQPVYQRIDADAIQPYSAGAITGGQALDEAKGHVKDFMLRQARPKDVEFFVGLAKMGPTKVEDLPMSVVPHAEKKRYRPGSVYAWHSLCVCGNRNRYGRQCQWKDETTRPPCRHDQIDAARRRQFGGGRSC